jgi:hypothetical protein
LRKHIHHTLNLRFEGESLFLAGAGTVECSTHNGFVKINITIPDFQVEAAIRIGANPGFVKNICPLTAEIR